MKILMVNKSSNTYTERTPAAKPPIRHKQRIKEREEKIHPNRAAQYKHKDI
jgi:hypothetical protein